MDFKIFIGLGNPGEEYRQTYHNAGAMFVEYRLAQEPPAKHGQAPSFSYSKTGSGIYVTPRVFMNDSGMAVKDALRYFNLSPSEMLVIHDDTDLMLGDFRLVFARGSAGHHGIDSIVSQLKTNDFWRLRIGVREPPASAEAPRPKAMEFVLKTIPKREREVLDQVFGAAGAAITKVSEKDVPLAEGAA